MFIPSPGKRRMAFQSQKSSWQLEIFYQIETSLPLFPFAAWHRQAKVGHFLAVFHFSVAFWPQKMAKKRAICPICLCSNCLIENILVFKCLIINILQIAAGQIGQIGQKQIGQIHFCTLRFPKIIINNI